MKTSEITNIRYGPILGDRVGKILFDFKGNTLDICEPGYVMLVEADSEAAAKWIIKVYGHLLKQL